MDSGNSFYTSISTSFDNVGEIVQFFIDHNVDVNQPDSEGIYPLEYGIMNESKPFIIPLLDSKKVDFSVKLNNNENYIHLVECCQDEEIVKEFIDRQIIDPNSEEFQKARQSIKDTHNNARWGNRVANNDN